MNRVIIVNNCGQNFSPAKEYGTLIHLTEGRLNLDDLNKLIYNLKYKLEGLYKDDLFILTGPTMLNIIVSYYVIEKFGQMKILALSKKQNEFSYKIQVIHKESIVNKR